jgi:hypothetical protein
MTAAQHYECDRKKIEAELVQAKVDYIANVPGAWDRYRYWQLEFERIFPKEK